MTEITDRERRKLLLLIDKALAIPSYDRDEMLVLRRKLEAEKKD